MKLRRQRVRRTSGAITPNSSCARLLQIFAWLLLLASASSLLRAGEPVVELPADRTAAGSMEATPAKSPLDDRPIQDRSVSHARTEEGTSDGVTSPTLDARRVVLALVLVIGLIFGLRWIGRYFFPAAVGPRASRAVQVLTRTPVAPKQQVMLLRIGKRVLVVADNGVQLSRLGEIADADEVASLVGQVQSEKVDVLKPFGSLFGRYGKAYENIDDAEGSDASDTSPAASADAEGAAGEQDPEDVASARAELSGLMNRVRVVSRQFGRS